MINIEITGPKKEINHFHKWLTANFAFTHTQSYEYPNGINHDGYEVNGDFHGFIKETNRFIKINNLSLRYIAAIGTHFEKEFAGTWL